MKGKPRLLNNALRWRRARKILFCMGDPQGKKTEECTPFIARGDAYLEVTGGLPAEYCEACAEENFSEHFEKEGDHA